MKDHINALQVGSPDPDLRNSPIVEETDYDYVEQGQQLQEAPVCYFNGSIFQDGHYVCSGSELLKCTRGSWLRMGSCDPDNP